MATKLMEKHADALAEIPQDVAEPATVSQETDKASSVVSTLTTEEQATGAERIAQEISEQVAQEGTKEKAKPEASAPGNGSDQGKAKRTKGTLPPVRYVVTPIAFAGIVGEGLLPLDACAGKLGVATGDQVAQMVRSMWLGGQENAAPTTWQFDTKELKEKASGLKVTSVLLGNAAMVRRLLGGEPFPADGVFQVDEPHERLDSVRGALGQAMLDAQTLASMVELRAHSSRTQNAKDPAQLLEAFVLRTAGSDSFLTMEETSRRIGVLAALGRIMADVATGKKPEPEDQATVSLAAIL